MPERIADLFHLCFAMPEETSDVVPLLEQRPQILEQLLGFALGCLLFDLETARIAEVEKHGAEGVTRLRLVVEEHHPCLVAVAPGSRAEEHRRPVAPTTEDVFVGPRAIQEIVNRSEVVLLHLIEVDVFARSLWWVALGLGPIAVQDLE